MRRVVSLFLPNFATDRVRREPAAPPPEAPLAMVGQVGPRRVVLAADQAARAAGLVVGMPVAKARILVPGLAIAAADPAADAAALARLAIWMLRRVAPIVAPDPPDGIVIDCTGADHLHGGEAAMLATLVQKLAEVGVTARGAIADTWGAAHGLARFAERPGVSLPGRARQDVVPLPLEALRLAPQTAAALRVLGFASIGDLLERPRGPLTLRFGPEPVRRLDQATGRRAEPIEPIRPDEVIAVERRFAEPIAAAETIAHHVGRLAEALCAALDRRVLGARRLDLVCGRVDDHAQAVRIGTARPLRDAQRMTRLLCDRIETIDPGFGIETLRLAAVLAEPVVARQAASGLVAPPEPDVAGLVDLLANRLGARRLYRVIPVESDVPERSLRRVDALAPPAGAAWRDWPRPARLFTRPEPIETMALLPDHPPASFTWRGVRRRVCRADGPERIFGEWWKHDRECHAVRDYFRIEDQAGGRWWVFRAGDGEDARTGSQAWFLHGLFG